MNETIDLTGTFIVHRHITFTDPEMAATLDKLPMYKVRWTPDNITAWPLPGHE